MEPVHTNQTTDRFNVEIDHTTLITPFLEKAPHTRAHRWVTRSLHGKFVMGTDSHD